jgi:peptidoglycan hydrolase-like protein with peptidoglycan-binding domain
MSISQPTADYPLAEGQYLSTPTVSRLSRSRGGAVVKVRRQLGLSPYPLFDAETEAAVRAWQESVELPVTGVITEIDWVLLFQPE